MVPRVALFGRMDSTRSISWTPGARSTLVVGGGEMMKRYLELAALWTFAAAVGLTTGETAAQSDPVQAFPAKPVHLVVPFAAGGGNDILARVISPKMGESFGQPVL